MGTGCSRPTDRFSKFQKLHSKGKKKSTPEQKSSPNPETNPRPVTEAAPKNPNDQRKVVDTIRLYTSNSFYEHLKKGKPLKDLLPRNSKEPSHFLELIEELRLYVSFIINYHHLFLSTPPPPPFHFSSF